jgi:hypothetical protein
MAKVLRDNQFERFRHFAGRASTYKPAPSTYENSSSNRVKAERKKAKKPKKGDDDGSAGVLVPAG